jgi:hypothetical protein
MSVYGRQVCSRTVLLCTGMPFNGMADGQRKHVMGPNLGGRENLSNTPQTPSVQSCRETLVWAPTPNEYGTANSGRITMRNHSIIKSIEEEVFIPFIYRGERRYNYDCGFGLRFDSCNITCIHKPLADCIERFRDHRRPSPGLVGGAPQRANDVPVAVHKAHLTRGSLRPGRT